MRRSLTVSLVGMAAGAAVGCSSTPQAVPLPTRSIDLTASTRASTAMDTFELPSASASTPVVAATSSTTKGISAPLGGLGHDHIVLTCKDSAGALPIGDAGGNTTVDGATLTGLRGKQDPPLAAEVGLVLPPGASLYFRKTPLYIEAGTGPVTLSLTEEKNEFLSWVPASVWTSGSPPDLQPWAAKSVTFQGCPDSGAMYLGGLLAADPARIFQLTGSHAGHKSTARVSLKTGVTPDR